MRRTKKKLIAKLGFITGEGDSISAANLKLKANVERALTGTYTPTFLYHRGAIGIMWREPSSYAEGWHWRVIDDPTTESSHLYGNWTDKRESASNDYLRYQLAQLKWQLEDGPVAPDIIINPQDAAEFVSWAKWQLDYKRLKDEGKSDVEAHREAVSG